MSTRPRKDPWQRFNFVLEIDGKPVAGFSEVTGLDTDAPPGEHGSVALKRGAANRQAFFEWQAQAVAARHAATIVLVAAARAPVVRWRLTGAWPNKIEGPTLSASANDVDIETLELTHEGLTLDE